MDPENINLEHEDFWGYLKQQQDLLRESWEEYFKALKSLEKEKEEILWLKKGVFKAAEGNRGKILHVNAESFSFNYSKFSGRRREAVPNKTDLSVLKSMKCALENLSSKEESSLGTETECADERVTDEKVVVDNRCRAETCMDTSENGEPSEEMTSSYDSEIIPKKLENDLNLQRSMTDKDHDAIEDQDIELKNLTVVYKTERIRLDGKRDAAYNFFENFQVRDSTECKQEPEIRCLKEHFTNLIYSWMDLLDKLIVLTDEKYELEKEKESMDTKNIHLELDGLWDYLKQQQDLLRESWDEYFAALKSLEKEKEELQRTKKEVFKTAEDIRGEILRVNADVFSQNCIKFSGRRREAVPNKADLSTLKSMKCALENLASKEGSPLGTVTECANNKVTDVKVVFDDRCWAETCVTTSENGRASEEMISSDNTETIHKVLEDDLILKCWESDEMNNAFEDQKIELENLTGLRSKT